MMKLIKSIFKIIFTIVGIISTLIVFFAFLDFLYEPPPPQINSYQLSKWRNEMRQGLSKKQVRDILGEPDHVQVTYASEEWSYKNGDVEFSTDNGKVERWNEPH